MDADEGNCFSHKCRCLYLMRWSRSDPSTAHFVFGQQLTMKSTTYLMSSCIVESFADMDLKYLQERLREKIWACSDTFRYPEYAPSVWMDQLSYKYNTMITHNSYQVHEAIRLAIRLVPWSGQKKSWVTPPALKWLWDHKSDQLAYAEKCYLA